MRSTHPFPPARQHHLVTAFALSFAVTACAGETLAPHPAAAPDRLTPGAVVQADRKPAAPDTLLVVWGDDSRGQISDAPYGDPISAIAAGGARQGLIIRDDGSLRLWGRPGPTPIVPSLPDSVANDRYDDAYLALTFLIAVRPNHTVRTWGSFYNGTPNGIPADPPAGLRARDVAGGSSHALALKTDWTLEAWGNGAAGQSVPAGKFSEVSARTTYSLALRRDGTLFGWGNVPGAPNAFATWQSDGAGHFFVPNESFEHIAAGNNHILALRANGSVAAWGQDSLGSTHAPAGVHFTAIAAGQFFSIGLDEAGLLHHWGDPLNGLLSHVPSGRFASIGAGARQASALRVH